MSMELYEFLRQHGVADVPHMIVNDQVIPVGNVPSDRRAAFEAAVAQFDWTAAALSSAKRERIDANRREAQRRIAAVLGLPPDTPPERLLAKEANLLMQAIDAVANNDTTTVSSMRTLKAQIDAIRAAENAAATAIKSATTQAEVNAVVVSWP